MGKHPVLLSDLITVFNMISSQQIKKWCSEAPHEWWSLTVSDFCKKYHIVDHQVTDASMSLLIAELDVQVMCLNASGKLLSAETFTNIHSLQGLENFAEIMDFLIIFTQFNSLALDIDGCDVSYDTMLEHVNADSNLPDALRHITCTSNSAINKDIICRLYT
jgi:hypothetical protein